MRTITLRQLALSAALGLPLLFPAEAGAAPPPAVLEYRHHMFDPAVSVLANRTIELMFDTARVEPGRRPSRIPVDIRPLDFTYEVDGVKRQAAEMAERTFTDALLIIRDGRIVHEQYLNRADANTHFMSYSAAKSFNSILLGFALQDGKVASIDEPITRYLPELAGTAYDGTTIRNVLQMRSGTDWNDNFFVPGPAKDINEAAFMRSEARFTSAAAWPRRAHPPGERFNYNTVDAALIADVVERATGRPAAEYMSEKLWRPAGMESHAFYLIDGAPGVGHAFTGGGFNATLRDYGRIGLMMLNQGRANGRQLLSASWVHESTTPVAAPNPVANALDGFGYAGLWWTLTGTNAYFALGAQGQFVFVDPDSRTVIVKLSHIPLDTPTTRATRPEILAFFRAALRWQP